MCATLSADPRARWSNDLWSRTSARPRNSAILIEVNRPQASPSAQQGVSHRTHEASDHGAMTPGARGGNTPKLACPGKGRLDVEVVLSSRPRDAAWEDLWRRVFSDIRLAELLAQQTQDGESSEVD